MHAENDPQEQGTDLEPGQQQEQEQDAQDLQAASTGAAGGDLARELGEQRDKYLRLAAEFDNFRKRAARERMEAGVRGQGELVRQLLDSLDDLGRFAHLEPAVTETKTVTEGVTMVEKKLQKVLQSAGLVILDPLDETFDPNLHEAVATEPAGAKEDDDTVARVYQLGYQFNGQLLRPARVVVKQWHG